MERSAAIHICPRRPTGFGPSDPTRLPPKGTLRVVNVGVPVDFALSERAMRVFGFKKDGELTPATYTVPFGSTVIVPKTVWDMTYGPSKVWPPLRERVNGVFANSLPWLQEA